VRAGLLDAAEGRGGVKVAVALDRHEPLGAAGVDERGKLRAQGRSWTRGRRPQRLSRAETSALAVAGIRTREKGAGRLSIQRREPKPCVEAAEGRAQCS